MASDSPVVARGVDVTRCAAKAPVNNRGSSRAFQQVIPRGRSAFAQPQSGAAFFIRRLLAPMLRALRRTHANLQVSFGCYAQIERARGPILVYDFES